MENTAKSQVCSSLCFTEPWLVLCVAVLVPFLAFFAGFLPVGSFSFLVTIPILFLSTIFIFKLSRKKLILVEEPAQDESLSSCSSMLEKEVGEKQTPEGEAVGQCNGAQQNEACPMDEYQVESTDFPSDSESSDDFSASDNFELRWVCSNKVGPNVAISESSESEDEEEDTLIEISLPVNETVHLNEESEAKLQADLPDYLPESIFSQQGVMELLEEIDEVTEEENLIEIDLSIGSIKCIGFEIESQSSC